MVQMSICLIYPFECEFNFRPDKLPLSLSLLFSRETRLYHRIQIISIISRVSRLRRNDILVFNVNSANITCKHVKLYAKSVTLNYSIYECSIIIKNIQTNLYTDIAGFNFQRLQRCKHTINHDSQLYKSWNYHKLVSLTN